MSKERAKRREEREAAAAVLAERRAAQAERSARREARARALKARLPRSGGRPTGILAERRRRQVGATFALLVVLNLLVFAIADDWGISALLLVASVLAAPVVHLMLFRRG